MIRQRSSEAHVSPKMVEVTCEVFAGPERARREGVPEGALVQRVVTRSYRSRWRQMLWRLRNPGGGRIQLDGKVI